MLNNRVPHLESGHKEVEFLIVGAGPAGLAAGSSFKAHQKSFAIIEGGSLLQDRDHSNQTQLGKGVGGSGLYSDGKFSFYPSATRLWDLPDRAALKAGYDWLRRHLIYFGLNPPLFPEHQKDTVSTRETKSGTLLEKKYPSFYLALQERKELTQHLQSECGEALHPGYEVTDILYNSETKKFICSAVSHDSSSMKFSSAAVIFAAGRYGSLKLKELFPEIKHVFHRLEIGVRIEQPNSTFFLENHEGLDPKLIIRTGADEEFRTFCCCRNGEIVTLDNDGMRTVSGRSDCAPSGRSNVGFNLRITDQVNGRQIWSEFNHALAKQSESTITESWNSFVNNQPEDTTPQKLSSLLGPSLSKRLANGLRRFADATGSNFSNATLTGPAVEAIGYYPELDHNLKTNSLPLWVAGDCTGLFRGLCAAFISGHYVATQAAHFSDTTNDL